MLCGRGLASARAACDALKPDDDAAWGVARFLRMLVTRLAYTFAVAAIASFVQRHVLDGGSRKRQGSRRRAGARRARAKVQGAARTARSKVHGTARKAARPRRPARLRHGRKAVTAR